MTVDRTNLICGLFLMVAGAVFAWQSLDVELGTWLRIGPGGLPIVLSVILILLGAVIAFSALRSAHAGDEFGVIPWRGMFFILLAPFIFGLTVRGLGFIGSVFITSLFASFASIKMKPSWALALAVALTIFSTLVFSYGLNLPYPRIGPWLTF